MKKYLISIVFLLSVNLVFAQDLIYTVSGELNENKTALDSILIENLTNSTRILFGNLPAQEYYKINLTKKTLGGTVGINSLEEAVSFEVLQNLPGKLVISYRKDITTNVNLAVYNINGQKVFVSENKIINNGNSLQVSLCNSGVFFVQLETMFGVQTFKAVGSANVKQHDIEISDEINSFAKLKSSQILNGSDFSFSPGDSIRMSVYKKDYYARPIGKNIVDSDDVKFTFKVSSETFLGISNAFVELDGSTSEVESYDVFNGEVRMIFAEDNQKLQPGDIFVVDVDTMGYLRKVVETSEKDGYVLIETEQAYFYEVFVDKNIKLNTSFIYPEVQLNNSNSFEEISSALTDENGYVHPVEIFYRDTIGNLISQSVIDESNANDRISIIDYSQNLPVDIFGETGESVHFYTEEGHTSLISDAIFEFDFEYEGKNTEDTKVKLGDLKTYEYYLDGRAEFVAKLALDMSATFEIENEKKLVDLKNVKAKFVVGIVPIWITFDSDIFGDLNITSDTALNAKWGFESSNNIKIGGAFNKSAGSFSPINSYETTDTIFPLNIEGDVNSSVRFEIYPRVEVSFYNSFASFAEIAPFVKSDYNSEIHHQTISGDVDSFLTWNSSIDLGLDLRVGSDLEFLGFDMEFDPTVINCFETPAWQSPTEIILQSTLPSEPDTATNISLIFKVTDSFDNPVRLCPIYITGDGTFDKEIVITDSIGEAEINWKLSGTEGENKFTVVINKADGTIINELNDSVNVVIVDKVPTVTTYYVSDITANSAILKGNVTSDGGFAIIERGFYWSETNTKPSENDNTILVDGTTGEFEAAFSGLKPSTIYFYRAFATSDIGISNGNVKSFKTEEEQQPTLTYQGREYRTVTINGKEWMAENLAYDVGNGCWAYNNIESNVVKYGRLYTWDAAKIACPSTDGWHLPTDTEWEQLAQYISSQNGGYSKVEDNWDSVGKHLKTTSGWYNFGNGIDDFGFSGEPAGFRASDGVFNYMSFGTGWWSSTETDAINALGRGLAFNGDIFYRSSKGKIEAVSVRCVR